MSNLSGDAHLATVSATYESWWSRVQNEILKLESSGEHELARLVQLALVATVGDTPPGERMSILWGTKVPSPYLASLRIVRDWIADTVIEHSQDCDAVIELGSGWGYNLYNIWLRGGPKRVPYHAFEYTEAGRLTATTVRRIAQDGPSIQVHPFDYRKPNLPLTVNKYKRVVVYTSHSIEQVDQLPQSLFHQIMDIAQDVTVLHFEPVGWQFRDELGQAVGLDFGQRAYCERRKYNQNLWEMLKSLETQGSIAIRSAEADVMGVKVYNSTSLIVWDKFQALV